MTHERTSFVLYKEYANHIKLLTMEQRGVLLTAIYAYECETELPEMDVVVQMAFSFIRGQLERDREKYNDVCAKRSQAGQRSAEARRNKTEQDGTKLTSVEFVKTKGTNVNKREQTGTNSTDNDNEYDNDTDNDTEYVSEHVSDIKKKTSKKESGLAPYGLSEALEAEVKNFIQARKQMRKPMTDRAIELFVKRVQSLGNSDAERIEMIQTAIERGWQTVYPPKEEKPKAKQNRFNSFEQRDYDYDALERDLIGLGGVG